MGQQVGVVDHRRQRLAILLHVIEVRQQPDAVQLAIANERGHLAD
jgi:hypothetical protein